MSGRTRLIILAVLILATVMEVTGDAIVRSGIGQQSPRMKLACFAGGAVLLFGYGFALNSAPIAFEKVVGIYIATLFIVWQVISYVAFRALPTASTLVGGAFIVAGGLIVAFWQAPEHG